MSLELPYFKFMVSEWLNDRISLMSKAEKGVFIDVCAFYWFHKTSVTKAMLKRRFSDASEELKQLLEWEIIGYSEEDELTIKFLDEQYKELSDRRQKRVEAGRKGGKSSGKQSLSKAQAELKQSSSEAQAIKNKNKNKNKKNANNSKNELTARLPDCSEYGEEATALAHHLEYSIVKRKPDHKYANNPPSLKAWVVEIEKLMRLDGKKYEKIKNIIDYTFTAGTEKAEFWAPNIQSGKKLRKHYDLMSEHYLKEMENKKQKDVYTYDKMMELVGNSGQLTTDNFERLGDDQWKLTKKLV